MRLEERLADGELSLVPIGEMNRIKETVKGYWTRRSESFEDIRYQELHSTKAQRWTDELSQKLTSDHLNVLDVGCGTGYFSGILCPLGFRVTGIDLTPDMIWRAKELMKRQGVKADFQVMDAEHLDFEDETFDAVISRNLTWTLPDPVNAYREWYRVLKLGGILLNYDAEYAKGFHRLDKAENCAHRYIEDELIEECHHIYHMLPISEIGRPEWDLRVLSEIGFTDIVVDGNVSDRIYPEKDRFYAPDRLFGIRALK